jgi:hypothetical protein
VSAGKLKQLGWNKEQLVVQTKLRFAGLWSGSNVTSVIPFFLQAS